VIVLGPLLGLVTVGNMIWFCTGVAIAGIYHLIKAKIQNRHVTMRWQFIGVPLAVGTVLYVAVQNQENANCVREFQQVLRDRSAISAENDAISLEQRHVVYDWMHNLVFPPPQVARLAPNDPDRQQWILDFTIDTDAKLRDGFDRQQANDAERAAHPLPPATCGLS